MSEIKEGALYKVVEIDGVKFEIYYGYESESERRRGWEPSPVYPDFIARSQLTPDGYLFANAYQEVCEHYEPISTETDFIWCENCKQFEKREEFIGLCKSPHNRVRKDE